MKLAADRPEPIPFYAEMSSINRLFCLRPGQAWRGLATGLHGSLTLGWPVLHQPRPDDCSERRNPRAVRGQAGRAGRRQPGRNDAQPGISDAYDSGANTLGGNNAVDSVAQGESGEGHVARAAPFRTTADAFLADNHGAELFGPSTLVVNGDGTDKMLALARSPRGN